MEHARPYTLLVLSLFLGIHLVAQESESAVTVIAEKAQKFEREKKFSSREYKSDNTLTLPFIDDFSFFTLPTNDPEIPEEWLRWQDNGVFINNTNCIDPPSQGVASFDGTGADGFPYDFSVQESYGSADTLTSCPLDLSAFDADDDVYLTFFIQSTGLTNAPELSDSIFVEFSIPGSDIWSWQWSLPGEPASDFNQYFIKVDDPIFFNDAFQFRFRNYATLSGSFDQWHLDYVYMDAFIDPATFDLRDVSFTDPVQTWLADFQSMPWTHFIDDPDNHMIFQQNVTVKNLRDLDNNITIDCEVLFEGTIQHDCDEITVSNFEANSSLTEALIVGGGGYHFDDTVADDCADFDVRYIVNSGIDDLRDNDTLRFTQTFSNYYAYDDGTAERAWSLDNSAGGELAVRYEVDQPDTLLGLYVCFIPYGENSEGESFILRVREDNGGLPGEQLVENFGFQEATIFEGSRNAFSYYEYDDPVPVDGTIHVGWVQQGTNTMNVGNDKNTNSNTTKLSFKTGATGQWLQSGITGSIMIRPVFAAGKGGDFVSVGEELMAQARLYPNPALDVLYIDGVTFASAAYEIVDLHGRVVDTGAWMVQQPVMVGDLPRGMYIIHLRSSSGDRVRAQWIKQ